MKTVPTLCATATVVGASAVGLSFGRTDHSLSNPKKKALPVQDLNSTSMPSSAHTSTAAYTTTTSSSYTIGPIPVAPTTNRSYLTSRSSYDGRPQRRSLRTRMTSGDTAVRRPVSAVESFDLSVQHVAASESTPNIPFRRPSWIKRISIITNSQPPSRAPSPAPLSPAVSHSNGSMAFSHDGSTAPMIGKRAPSPLPPNVLVKRSSSIRTPHESSTHVSASLRPSFRRPATSHQRSATFQQRMVTPDLTPDCPPVDGYVHPIKEKGEIEYAQFFTAKIAKEGPLAKRRGQSANTSTFRRISPDGKHKPILVLARSVAIAADVTDESASEDGGSVYFVSRPSTSFSMAAVTSSRLELQSTTHQSQLETGSTTAAMDNASRPRRSFSITNLIPSAASRRQWISRVPSKRLIRKTSQRASSAPMISSIDKRPLSTSNGDAREDTGHPASTERDTALPGGNTESSSGARGSASGFSSSPSSALPDRGAESVFGDGLASIPQLELIASDMSASNQAPPSPTLAQPGVRPSRYSSAPSEQASTLVGSSDNEVRGLGSGDEDDADFQSETLFDSLRTGATRSSSAGARGPRIETIFDESPPAKVKITALRDLLPPGVFGEPTLDGAAGQQSIAVEEETLSTPIRAAYTRSVLHNSSSFAARASKIPHFPILIPSSPPSMPKPLSLGTLEWDSRDGDDHDDSSRWSLEDVDVEHQWIDLPAANQATTPTAKPQPNPQHLSLDSSPLPTTPPHSVGEQGDRDTRSSIFDWSEQNLADKSSGTHIPPRPRTVHGKKDADRRSNRSVGRRNTSGLHARSQSVPAVPDVASKRNTVVTNKFGTWGVGSKGVTEDWNDDFEFPELSEESSPENTRGTSKTDVSRMMVVPKTIQEQQNNVLANIGLLREWGLLIEELKEHRMRAAALGILDGPNAEMWEEVDAMIDLADQEVHDEGVSRLSPPSSPGYDEDAFDKVSAGSPGRRRAVRKPGFPIEEASTPSHRPKRKTILPPNHAIFGPTPQSSPIPPKTKFEALAISDPQPIITRPRKDSEAKARLIIEALQKRQLPEHITADQEAPSPHKKVPFDTATLRRIVPHVNTLTRRVKDTIRNAEGLYSRPKTSPQPEEPSFSKIFFQDTEDASSTKLMTVM